MAPTAWIEEKMYVCKRGSAAAATRICQAGKRPGILVCYVAPCRGDLDSEDWEVSVLTWPSRSLLHITVSTLPEHTYIHTRTIAELPVVLQTQIQAPTHTCLSTWPGLQLGQLIYRCHHCEIGYVMQPVC